MTAASAPFERPPMSRREVARLLGPAALARPGRGPHPERPCPSPTVLPAGPSTCTFCPADQCSRELAREREAALYADPCSECGGPQLSPGSRMHAHRRGCKVPE